MPFSLKITKAKMKFELQTYFRKLLADTLTPVNIYLKLRDVYAGSILLESADYHGRENSLSYICSSTWLPEEMGRIDFDWSGKCISIWSFITRNIAIGAQHM